MAKVMEALNAVAGKLGTTVDSLAPHYVKYVWAQSVAGAAIGVCLLVAAGLLFRAGMRQLPESYDRDATSGDKETASVSATLGITGGIGCVVAGLIMVGANFASMIAPEGYAVAQILGAVK